MSTKICLVLTEETIENNLQLVKDYAGYYDLVELRVDLLFSNETFYVRKFPELAGVPSILTCRRISDGGKFNDGEGARFTILAKALTFLDNNPRKNFAYVDFEQDFASLSLEEAARAFDIKIIRSLHNLKTPLSNITKEIERIRHNDDEIVKLATIVPTLQDFVPLLFQSPNSKKPYIVSGLGKYGYLSRIFAQRLDSELVYTFSEKYIKKHQLENELLDPITLNNLYRFRSVGDTPKIFAVVGSNVAKSKSPELHNTFFKDKNIPACYVPISVDSFDTFFSFAKKINIQGASVTTPFKKDAVSSASEQKGTVKNIGVANTLINKNGTWQAYNTDVEGFRQAITEFLGDEKLEKQKIAVLGAGGAAQAVCYALYTMLKIRQRKNICVFNRSKLKAEELAEKYGFSACPLLNNDETYEKLRKFSSLIINCTTLGTGKNSDRDPISFYSFTGTEKVFDLIYEPERTKLLQRAKKAGCRISNGYRMLEIQAMEQSKLFMGEAQ